MDQIPDDAALKLMAKAIWSNGANVYRMTCLRLAFRTKGIQDWVKSKSSTNDEVPVVDNYHVAEGCELFIGVPHNPTRPMTVIEGGKPTGEQP